MIVENLVNEKLNKQVKMILKKKNKKNSNNIYVRSKPHLSRVRLKSELA